MAHPSNMVSCSGPDAPHAFDGIPLLPREGELDRVCPLCLGHGQWNAQIDLVSQRSIRCPCPKCEGRGWIETGDDPVPEDDIILSPEGEPEWTVRLEPSDDREEDGGD